MSLWVFNPVVIIYFSAAGISFLLSYLSWRLRPARGTVYFSLMMLSISIWISAYILELFSTDFNLKIFVLKFEYLGKALAVYLWLIFISTYTQYDGWLKKRMLVVLALIPAFSIVNIFIAPGSNLLHSHYQLENIKNVIVLTESYRFGFYLWASYAYCVIGGGILLMVIRMMGMPTILRRQLYIVVPMAFVIIVPNAMFISQHNPIYPYDPTPISLAIAGLLFLFSIYKHKFLDVMPVAHAQVFKNMRSAVIVIDSREQILDINPVAEHLFDCTYDNVAGKSVLTILPECEKLLHSDVIQNEIKEEIYLASKNRTFELKINKLTDSKNEEIGKILLLFDITAQVAAINELDAYARTVAHDLKNPLNVVLGYAQLLDFECKEKDSSIMHNHLKGITNGALHMNEIVEGLLLLAQVRNIEKIDIQKLNMSTVLSNSLQRLWGNIKESSAKIQKPESMIDSYGYGIWVEEVWINLLSNAIKYGGERPVIKIDSYKKKDKVYYSVTDFGSGLTEEEQQNVFVEFTRLSRHKSKTSGHGIGLSIVKRIVEKLDGEVGVQSVYGEGSTFYFSLPAIE
jgi:PAS domain S-box-containing protein